MTQESGTQNWATPRLLLGTIPVPLMETTSPGCSFWLLSCSCCLFSKPSLCASNQPAMLDLIHFVRSFLKCFQIYSVRKPSRAAAGDNRLDYILLLRLNRGIVSVVHDYGITDRYTTQKRAGRPFLLWLLLMASSISMVCRSADKATNAYISKNQGSKRLWARINSPPRRVCQLWDIFIFHQTHWLVALPCNTGSQLIVSCMCMKNGARCRSYE